MRPTQEKRTDNVRYASQTKQCKGRESIEMMKIKESK